jgi:glucan 1,3-beta-glucosidase
MNDLTFNGGNIGLQVGNQQFTMRNIVFNNCVTAISQLWSWGWLYQGLTINNCQRGIDISANNGVDQQVGSVTIIDSTITNTPVGVITAFNSSSQPNTAGSLVLENVVLQNVATAVQQAGGGTLLAGTSGSTTIAAWGEGNQYTPNGPKRFQGQFIPTSRPASLLSGNTYYARSKPQYGDLPASSFQSVRSAGATGNGVTDDTTALQNCINNASTAGTVVYFDSGTYRITNTLVFPAGSKIVGEAYPIIMSSGNFFNDMNNPKPVVQVGNPRQSASPVEWSDMIVSTQGAQAGAIGIEFNLATSGAPSGLWDVHVRIGGFAGSNLQASQCPTTPGSPTVNEACIGAYMLMHVTASASNLYMENTWLWTADHDIDSSDNTQITIYSGRGLYIESTAGSFWLQVLFLLTIFHESESGSH